MTGCLCGIAQFLKRQPVIVGVCQLPIKSVAFGVYPVAIRATVPNSRAIEIPCPGLDLAKTASADVGLARLAFGLDVTFWAIHVNSPFLWLDNQGMEPLVGSSPRSFFLFLVVVDERSGIEPVTDLPVAVAFIKV